MRITALLFCLFFPSFVWAATQGSLTIDPKNPEPYSSVTVSLVSYSFDPNTALIRWTSQGKELLAGYGEKKLVVKTGALGEALPVEVSAETDNGDFINLQITIVPQSVTLLYESKESYVPPFYEGLALPSESAKVRFVAFPSITEGGKAVSAEAVSYFWYVNGELKDSLSGRGKQSASFFLDALSKKTDVRVVAKAPKGTTAEKKTTVYPHAIMPLFYTYDDIFGVNYSSIIERRYEAQSSFTLAFEPFYLSLTEETLSGTIFSWTLEGLPVTPQGGRLLSLQPKENDFGSKSLSISVNNTKRRLQSISYSLDIIFDTR